MCLFIILNNAIYLLSFYIVHFTFYNVITLLTLTFVVYSNTYTVANNGQLFKLKSNILDTQTLIVTDDDGSLESIDEQPTAAVIENGNVTGIVMSSKTNDATITQYELRPNNNASKLLTAFSYYCVVIYI